MSLRKPLIILGILLKTATTVAYSQSVYINTRTGIFQLTGSPSGHERRPLDNHCIDPNLLSIAAHKDTIYYNTWAGELKRFKLGVASSCETLVSRGLTGNAMTIDRNGIVYIAGEDLLRYDPRTKQLTELGKLPFNSTGDMIFFNDKLLLSGTDPNDPTIAGIFEIEPTDLGASKLYMRTPDFVGLISYPVACGDSRYFGLSSPVYSPSTKMIELDLVNKQVIGNTIIIPEKILDGASITEGGMDNKVAITNLIKTHPGNCSGNNGTVTINASTLNSSLTYTLLNNGTSQPSGRFTGLTPGSYQLRITDDAGCSTDTTIVLAANIPVGGCNELMVPNAFTPNNDGKNDHFTISVPTGFKDVYVQVFNRGGSKVYEGKNGNINWNGYYQGSKQPIGVYVYMLTYTDQAGIRQNMKGTLALLQ